MAGDRGFTRTVLIINGVLIRASVNNVQGDEGMTKTFRNTVRSLTASCLLFGITLAQAAVPATLNYQGFLTNPTTGQPLTTVPGSPLTVTFKLFNVASGGTALYTEVQPVSVTNGVFNVQIGSVTTLSLQFDVPYWLEVAVGATTLTPRQPLASSATALRANVADSFPSAPSTCSAGLFATGVDVHGNASGCAAPLMAVPGSGFNNTASGNGVLTSNTTGYGNTGAGSFTLPANTSGYWNSAFGANALSYNTTGNSNTASGQAALLLNSTGSNNTAQGQAALYSNTTGGNNTASGTHALSNNTTASNNLGIGYNALWSQSFDNGGAAWDSFNTAVGSQALYSNQPTANNNGVLNTAVGGNALYANTTGYQNTATGANALQNNTVGYYNTALGQASLQTNSTGNWNTAVGQSALKSNTTGASNIAIGQSAGIALTSGNNNIDIGNAGVAGEANTLRIGNSNQTRTFIAGIEGATISDLGQPVLINSQGQLGTVSITNSNGNTAYGYLAMLSITDGQNNTASGSGTLYYNSHGSGNTAVGSNALFYNVSGSSNAALGQDAGSRLINGNNNVYIANYGVDGENNTIRIGRGADSIFDVHTDVYTAGNLHSEGDISARGTVLNTSDRNVKENFSAVNAQDVLAKVVALPVQLWNYKRDNASTRHIGPMAQDFAAAFSVGVDDKHIATVDESGVALAAIQGLNAKLENLVQAQDEKIAVLEKDRQRQAAQIAELQRSVELLVAQIKRDEKLALMH
jgi:hypothetical protein